MIEPAVTGLGYRLVRVRMMGGQRRPTLQVMVERLDERPVNVDDCAQVSGTVSAILDVDDPLPGSYLLEVSSPGIDRPLVRLEDFARFSGFEARVETAVALEGRKRFRGRLLGVEGSDIRMRLNEPAGTEVIIPFPSVATAKLVITDDLIEATQRQQGAS